MRSDRLEATHPDQVDGWYADFSPPMLFTLGTITLELRVDLVEATQDDAFTVLGVNRNGGLWGYLLGRDQDEIFLRMYGDQGGWYTAYYFAQSRLALANANTALSLAFTRLTIDAI